MSSDPNDASDCCNNCDDEIVTQVPGPQGPAGDSGTSGSDGLNAYTLTTAQFVMPDELDTVTVAVASTAWMVVGEVVYTVVGYMQVDTILSAVSVVLLNLADAGNQAYQTNSAPGSIAAPGTVITPGGLQGPMAASPSIDIDSVSPTESKGDLMVDNGGNAPQPSVVRFAVGTDGQVLIADSTQPTGLRYGAVSLSTASITGTLPIANGGTGQTARQAAINALLNDTPAVGALEYYNGTNWVSLAKGTGLQVLRVNSGATGLEYATITGVGVLQVQQAGVSAATVVTEVTPFDNTIPQVGEGKEILTVTLTPISAASRVFIEVLVNVSCDALDNVTLSLFNGVANPNAIAATSTIAATVNAPRQISLLHEYSPGSVTPIAFSVRLGNATAANNTTMNGVSGAAKLGGVQRSWIIVTEVG